MFVVSLVGRGKLQQTDIRHDPNEALKLAREWIQENRDIYGDNGYVAIDCHIKEGTFRCIEIGFDQPDDEARLFLHEKNGIRIISGRKERVKNFFLSVLEFTLIQLGEYLKNRK